MIMVLSIKYIGMLRIQMKENINISLKTVEKMILKI